MGFGVQLVLVHGIGRVQVHQHKVGVIARFQLTLGKAQNFRRACAHQEHQHFQRQVFLLAELRVANAESRLAAYHAGHALELVLIRVGRVVGGNGVHDAGADAVHQRLHIIGGADGPMAIYTTMKLAPHLLPQISVAAYSYMALMPLIQPPIMKLLTNKEERKIMMKQPRYVSRLEKIAFPIVMALIVNVFLPPVAPLITMLMLGNLLRECLVVGKLAETAANTLLNMVTLVLTVAIGSTMAADTFLTSSTILIIFLGLVAFAFGTGSGVVCAKLMNTLSGGRINPLIGSAGIASVPIAARVSHLVGQQESRRVFLLMHAMGPNLAGVFGTAISGGIMLALLGG